MDSDLIELLTQNLSRFDENSEVDRAGVYYVLGEFRHLLSPHSVTDLLSAKVYWRIWPRKHPSLKRLARIRL